MTFTADKIRNILLAGPEAMMTGARVATAEAERPH